MSGSMAQRTGIRLTICVVACGTFLVGLVMFVRQLEVLRNNEGGQISDFPYEGALGNAGLILMSLGLVFFVVFLLFEAYGRRKISGTPEYVNQ